MEQQWVCQRCSHVQATAGPCEVDQEHGQAVEQLNLPGMPKDDRERCLCGCGRPIEQSDGSGRPRLYASDACRARARRARLHEIARQTEDAYLRYSSASQIRRRADTFTREIFNPIEDLLMRDDLASTEPALARARAWVSHLEAWSGWGKWANELDRAHYLLRLAEAHRRVRGAWEQIAPEAFWAEADPARWPEILELVESWADEAETLAANWLETKALKAEEAAEGIVDAPTPVAMGNQVLVIGDTVEYDSPSWGRVRGKIGQLYGGKLGEVLAQDLSEHGAREWWPAAELYLVCRRRPEVNNIVYESESSQRRGRIIHLFDTAVLVRPLNEPETWSGDTIELEEVRLARQIRRPDVSVE